MARVASVRSSALASCVTLLLSAILLLPMIGGLVGRVVRGEVATELFGKQVTRVHGMKRVATEQDQSYEFFLVVRPTTTGEGRLVKRWRFASDERSVEKYVKGYLNVEPSGKTATVTMTGLKRRVEERVDL